MLHRVALYRAQLFTTVQISAEMVDVARMQIFSEWPPSELRQTRFTNCLSARCLYTLNFWTCITFVSICSYVPASAATSFMLYVDGMGRATPRAFNNSAAGIKGKFVKWYALRTVLRASSRIEWEAPPRKTTSNNENMKKEESNPHDWSRNHGDTSPRCLQGNIERILLYYLLAK